VAGANEQPLFLLEINGAAQVRTNCREGIDLISVPAYEPNPADHVVGMYCPGVATQIADDHLLGLPDMQIVHLRYRLEFALWCRPVTGIEQVGHRRYA
jgi:hypothetical protein